MLILLTVLIAADALTTVIGVKRGLSEANPLIAWLIDAMGLVPALLLTHAALAGAVWWYRLDGWALWVLIAAYGALLASNLYAIARR